MQPERATNLKRRAWKTLRSTFLVFSTLVGVVAVVMWIRGFWRIDLGAYGDKSQEHGIALIAGQNHFVVALNVRCNWIGWDGGAWPRDADNATVEAAEWVIITGDNGPAEWVDRDGFLFGWGTKDYPFAAVGLPEWFVAAIALLPVALWLIRRWKEDVRVPAPDATTGNNPGVATLNYRAGSEDRIARRGRTAHIIMAWGALLCAIIQYRWAFTVAAITFVSLAPRVESSNVVGTVMLLLTFAPTLLGLYMSVRVLSRSRRHHLGFFPVILSVAALAGICGQILFFAYRLNH